MTVKMSEFAFLGVVMVVILMASVLALAQTPPTVPIAVSGDADTGPETVSVTFLSGELAAGVIWAGQTLSEQQLFLSFKIRVTSGKNYTSGATEYFSTRFLMLHTPKGEAIGTQHPDIYNGDCPNSCTISYIIPSDAPGAYTITNDYVGCCGTKHGQVTFTVPPWRAHGAARQNLGGTKLNEPNPEHRPLMTNTPPVSRRSPVRIGIDLSRASAVIGQTIELEVSLMDDRDDRTVADRTIDIHLEVRGGSVSPGDVSVQPGSASASARLSPTEAGDVLVRAFARGLQEGRKIAAGCTERRDIGHLLLSNTQQLALADGKQRLAFLLKFTAADGTPAVGTGLKTLQVDHKGVGRLEPDRTGAPRESVPEPAASSKQQFDVESDQCAWSGWLASDNAGQSTVSASFAELAPKEAVFFFLLPVTFTLLLLIALGGLCGAFLSAAKKWASASRWRRRKWMVWLASGMLAGITTFLFYRVGLVKALPQLSTGTEVGFLLGVVGGFLGPAAVERIAGAVLPAGRAKPGATPA